MHQKIETIYDASGKWRVTIFRRADRTYGLDWEHYSDDPYEHCWIPDTKCSETFCDTLEIARREAQGRIEVKHRCNEL